MVQAPTLFKFPQRLDSMVGNNEKVGILVNILQDLSEHLVKRTVLVRERIHTNAVQRRVVACVVGLNGIEPMPDAVLAGLNEHGEVSPMVAQQVVKQLRLLSTYLRYLQEPVVDSLCLFAFQFLRG